MTALRRLIREIEQEVPNGLDRACHAEKPLKAVRKAQNLVRWKLSLRSVIRRRISFWMTCLLLLELLVMPMLRATSTSCSLRSLSRLATSASMFA